MQTQNQFSYLINYKDIVLKMFQKLLGPISKIIS